MNLNHLLFVTKGIPNQLLQVKELKNISFLINILKTLVNIYKNNDVACTKYTTNFRGERKVMKDLIRKMFYKLVYVWIKVESLKLFFLLNK